MNAQENRQLDEIFRQLGALETKINAVIVEQANAANRRGEIYEEQHTTRRDIADIKSDLAEMRPAFARGKKVLYVTAGILLATGFTASEVKAWLLKFLALAPCFIILTTSALAQGSWVDQLTNQNGKVCCYDNDGRRLDDPDWRTINNGYEVLFKEGWLFVPPDAIVTMRNRDGIARVWSTMEERGRLVRCFLPGALG